VFDGHGGKEVAKFVEAHFVTELITNNNFMKKNYEDALKETFLKMDDLLNTDEGKKEILAIKTGGTDEDSSNTYAW